ncbi:MAG: DUF2934 domain-containing protein [Candidatus Omnitrophica bacterium]|nr:DUF2934 domain-containing protein [Candidatus Omnitrophota bacterium]
MEKSTGFRGFSKTSTPKFSDAELTARIQKKAKEIWERSGRAQGRDLANWLEAEKWVKSGKA